MALRCSNIHGRHGQTGLCAAACNCLPGPLPVPSSARRGRAILCAWRPRWSGFTVQVATGVAAGCAVCGAAGVRGFTVSIKYPEMLRIPNVFTTRKCFVFSSTSKLLTCKNQPPTNCSNATARPRDPAGCGQPRTPTTPHCDRRLPPAASSASGFSALWPIPCLSVWQASRSAAKSALRNNCSRDTL